MVYINPRSKTWLLFMAIARKQCLNSRELTQVADQLGISESYRWVILNRLHKAGLIKRYWTNITATRKIRKYCVDTRKLLW